MNHKNYREWLRLSIYDELDDEQKQLLKDHLRGCSDCRAEIDALLSLHATVSRYRIGEPAPEFLQEARGCLQSRLAGVPGYGMAAGWIDKLLFPRYRFAMAAAALLFVGFIIGYNSYSLVPSHPVSNTTAGPETRNLYYGRIENVQFLHPASADTLSGADLGPRVEFTFDEVHQVRIQGNLDDPKIQKFLALALVNERNPGVRMQSASAINASKPNSADPEIRAALIKAMKYDENPGVRMQAMETLARYPYDESTKKAFLHVVMNDKLSGLRIQAINVLTSDPMSGHLNDGETRKAFKEKLVHDENSYIRFQATTILKGSSL
jgi:hypothetical protein